MVLINPYNFVPLKGTEPASKSGYPPRQRFHEGNFNGLLECSLKAESPLISLDQQRKDIVSHREFGFLKNKQGTPVLHGTSLKGMIRFIYEAITDSCLIFAATDGNSKKSGADIPYNYQSIGAYTHESCQGDELCPTCRLFGTVQGENTHFQSRVTFTDAVLIKGNLIKGPFHLKELSSPKPHHSPTYGKSKNQRGPIAGRKFYYHQGEAPSFTVNSPQSRTITINEYAPVESEFIFKVYMENIAIDQDELGKLLLAIELHQGLGHKIGLGKAIGMGSCTITIDRSKSNIYKAEDRYKFNKNAPPIEIDKIKADPKIIPDELIEVLRLNKPDDGKSIGYPPWGNYPGEVIDSLGVFGGEAKRGGRPDWPEEVALTPPQLPSPPVKLDEKAVWLKEVFQNKLIFVTQKGEDIERPRHGFQGKKESLKVGEWFILSGTISSKPA